MAVRMKCRHLPIFYQRGLFSKASAKPLLDVRICNELLRYWTEHITILICMSYKCTSNMLCPIPEKFIADSDIQIMLYIYLYVA